MSANATLYAHWTETASLALSFTLDQDYQAFAFSTDSATLARGDSLTVSCSNEAIKASASGWTWRSNNLIVSSGSPSYSFATDSSTELRSYDLACSALYGGVEYSGSIRITVIEAARLDYSGNGNTSGSSPLSASASPATVAGAGSLARSGYAFASWNTKADGTGSSYAIGTEISFDGVLTLYAQWRDVAPAAIAGLAATVYASDESLELAWSAPEETDIDYLQISYGADATPTIVRVSPATTALLISDATSGTFRVIAVDMGGNSSAEASITL